MNRDYPALNLLQPETESDPYTENRYRQCYELLPRLGGHRPLFIYASYLATEGKF
jgi:hypothetical protein